MRFIFACLLSVGWAYLGHTFHWPTLATFTAIVMTIIFAFYVSRVVAEDQA